jgi:hypothetical protein
MAEKKEVGVDLSVVSYIFGITSIVLAFFIPAAGIVFGIIGIFQSKKKNGELSKKGKRLSVIGLILSIILLAVQIASMFINLQGILGY